MPLPAHTAPTIKNMMPGNPRRKPNAIETFSQLSCPAKYQFTIRTAVALERVVNSSSRDRRIRILAWRPRNFTDPLWSSSFRKASGSTTFPTTITFPREVGVRRLKTPQLTEFAIG
jgi:hypothetical protein